MSIATIAKNPAAQVTALIGALFAVFQIPMLHSVGLAFWMSLGELFTLVSIGALTLPPHWPPSSTTDWLVVVVGGAFVAKVGLGVYENFDRRI